MKVIICWSQVTGYSAACWRPSSIKIGRDGWIGRGLFIGSGVEIGDKCVIGADSVVVKSLPSNSIAVGAGIVRLRG